jgi:hypothetical protein
MRLEDGVHQATTDEERQAIWRERYQIYVEEMERYASIADHENRWLVEPVDASSRLFYASATVSWSTVVIHASPEPPNDCLVIGETFPDGSGWLVHSLDVEGFDQITEEVHLTADRAGTLSRLVANKHRPVTGRSLLPRVGLGPTTRPRRQMGPDVRHIRRPR